MKTRLQRVRQLEAQLESVQRTTARVMREARRLLREQRVELTPATATPAPARKKKTRPGEP